MLFPACLFFLFIINPIINSIDRLIEVRYDVQKEGIVIKLTQIYYALKVAENGSMNKTAENLYISQPTLTNAIKDLEEEIGIRIFERTSKGVILTREGSSFLTQALLREELLDVPFRAAGECAEEAILRSLWYADADMTLDGRPVPALRDRLQKDGSV